MAAMGWLAAVLALTAFQQDSGEYIGRAPLGGFVSGYQENAQNGSIEEFVPRGETVQRWTQMVTVLRLTDVAATTSAERYMRDFAGRITGSCPNTTTVPVDTVTISGRTAARFIARCPRNPDTGLPETLYAVAIPGRRDMHVVQIAFRRVATAADLELAVAQLSSVRLCTAGSRETVCRRR